MRTQFAYSSQQDTALAFEEVCRELTKEPPACLFLWLNPGYDLEVLASLMESKEWPVVVAATTAGLINRGRYHTEGMSLTALYTDRLQVHTFLVQDLHSPEADFQEISRELEELVRRKPSGSEMFAALLIDGLSEKEEEFTGKLYTILGQIPLIGGSAGDGLNFKETLIYHSGRFRSECAVISVFETSIPFQLFKLQHHRPTSDRVVVTEVDTNKRVVRGLSGRPAGVTYGQILGVPVCELSDKEFSSHSLALTVGDEVYVRSISRMGEDKSLTFFCSLDPGSVLTVAESKQPLETLKGHLDSLEEKLGGLGLILSFDCILRRLEFERGGLLPEVENLLSRAPSTGFCTYGEQFNALHVNQSMVGVAFANA